MGRSMLALVSVVAVLVLASLGPLGAAELPIPTKGGYVSTPPNCGTCGCLTVRYVYHRELRSTYGASFDPRNYDTTEPQFYLGRVRAYPQYFADDVQVGGAE